MTTYRFVVASVNPSEIYNDIPSVLNVPTPDSIENETLTYYHQTMANPNAIIFTFSSALSGPEVTALNSYMSTYVGIHSDDDRAILADIYLSAGISILSGFLAKKEIDGKNDTATNIWFTQMETIVNALNSGFLTVALDRLTGLTATLINFLTGTMTSAEVTELRQLLQKLLGKTVT